jgi:hypothetical protein
MVVNKKNMKKYIYIIAFFISFSVNAQIQRAIEGSSVIRKNILVNQEFNFFRDWTNIASFKSGLGETVKLYPIVFSTPDKKIVLQGLQLDAEVKPQESSITTTPTVTKGMLKRTIFIDKDDVIGMIAYIERDIVPNLKTTYKKQSKEYVFKSNEMFFSFLIDEKDLRITIHIADYGPLGNKPGGDQIEFWTESKVDDIPVLLNTLKVFAKQMK